MMIPGWDEQLNEPWGLPSFTVRSNWSYECPALLGAVISSHALVLKLNTKIFLLGKGSKSC